MEKILAPIPCKDSFHDILIFQCSDPSYTWILVFVNPRPAQIDVYQLTPKGLFYKEPTPYFNDLAVSPYSRPRPMLTPRL